MTTELCHAVYSFKKETAMPYYVLNKGYLLRGWKGLPFGLCTPDPHRTRFFRKEQYKIIYALDGRHALDEESMSEKEVSFLHDLVEKGIAVPSDGKQTIAPAQEYKSYPAMYKNSVQWSVTGRCNYHCRHCFMSAPDYHGEDLSMEQCIYILDELQRCGVRCISLTGGEPLVNPHFNELLEEIAKRGFYLDTIYSNGLLIDEALLDKLDELHLFPAFHISFDGVGWHDWLRGEKGAEETAIRAFRLLHKRGYQISSSMCLHRHNISTLRETIRLAKELGLVYLKINTATPAGRWKNETEHFISDDEAYQAIWEYIPQFIEDGKPLRVQFCGMLEYDNTRDLFVIPFHRFSGVEGAESKLACGAVRNSMYISPKGQVLPCMSMGGTAIDPMFDSILEKPLSDILTDSYYHSVSIMRMKAIIDHNERCLGCSWRLACGGGCRSTACGETCTDYKGIDEETCYFFRSGWCDKTIELVKKLNADHAETSEPDNPETAVSC